MKALFLALLLGNLLFFGWSRWHVPAGSRESIAQTLEVPSLTLADEAAAASRRDAAAAASKTEQAASSRCLSVGPFRDLPEASEASVALRGLGYGPHTRVAEGDIWAGLWVYLEDLPSRAEAQRIVGILKENGMSDAYLMPSSEQSIDISLGIFSEIPRAQRRATEVRKLGFVPAVAERTRRGTVYWLDVALKPGSKSINPADIQRPNQDGSGTIVRLEVKPCPAQSVG